MLSKSVLVTNYLEPRSIDLARQMFSYVDEQYNISPADLLREIGNFDALLCRSATKVTAHVLVAGAQGKLKIVASATSGIDHIDLNSAKQHGITVCNTPFGVTNANAEFNIGCLIALSRNFVHSTRLMQQGVWDQQMVLGHEISGRTLGIVGFGRIGQLTARYASIFNMNVIAYDPYSAQSAFQALGVQAVSLDELMLNSDYIVVNVPKTIETLGMIGSRELALMKSSAYLIHVARGGIVDEEELIRLLTQHRIAGACVDVFLNEPVIDQRFFVLDNVILTPHVGCSTQESRYRVGSFALRELELFFTGNKPQCQIV